MRAKNPPNPDSLSQIGQIRPNGLARRAKICPHTSCCISFEEMDCDHNMLEKGEEDIPCQLQGYITSLTKCEGEKRREKQTT
ncbi:hypothetical protein [Phaffia rhodozyma]|uniref:Uncharacterized protein n=1 Tax=Phaffia rhodozyma TaxID=264483 RepID=A0A0F7SU00_PHARH|nr:hypothetical protein [Phaffia rhodozyma]